MKNKKRTIIIFSAILLFLVVLSTITYNILSDENRLTTAEKEWLTQNTSNFNSISVINNIDVVGKNGQGVLYDFINDFDEEYNLAINPVTYNAGEEITGRAFKVKTEPAKEDLVFYEEHYVLLSKEYTFISDAKAINSLNVGVLQTDSGYLAKYLNGANLKPYLDSASLIAAFNTNVDIQYIIVPMETYLNTILSSNYEIVYHFSDIIRYYVFEPLKDDILSSIVKKYFASWKEENLNEAKNNSLLTVFTDSLNITSQDLDKMTAKVSNYGFVNNSPYEVISGGKYGGIISEYLNRFKDFSGVEFKCIKYKNYKVFNSSIDQGKVDIYFDYYNLLNEYKEVNSLMKINYKVIAAANSKLIISSEAALFGKEIYVLKNSLFEDYFKSLGSINVKTYDSNKELFKLTEEDVIIAIDSQTYNYYANDKLNGYNDRFEGTLNKTYQFKFKKNNALSKLFSKYISTLDPQETLYAGLYNHSLTIAKGTIQSIIAKYTLLLFAIVGTTILVFYKSRKKVKIAKKIRKDEKIKYIDRLTSLKNRNYLSENIESWNKNTLYPQTAIIVDLNRVQEVNDSFGYEEGDRQIRAAANILIKTQLDNSDIIRTNGNEFLIYLVGYSEKQIVSYIRKLYKEFNGLPHEHGAALGYSMITDDIKTLEDAINEAVEDMRNKKEEFEEER